MNSIDAFDYAIELLIRVRHNSDKVDFDWKSWERDVDFLHSNLLNTGGLNVRHVGGGEGGVKTGGTEGMGGGNGNKD